MAELTKEYFDQQLGKLVTKSSLEEVLDKRFEKMVVMVAKGFEQTAKDIARLEQRIVILEVKIEALSAKLTNYMELSDKRYLELKHKNLIIAKWLKQVAEKTGVKIDLAELEKF